MAYFLDFDERALKEWRKLGSTVREQLKKKLVEVLESPRIEANKLRGMPDCYKIKLRSSGYRLVYQVIDEKVVVFVISVASAFVLGGDKTDGDGTLGQVTEKVQEEQAAQATENTENE